MGAVHIACPASERERRASFRVVCRRGVKLRVLISPDPSLVGFKSYVIDSESCAVVISRPNDDTRIDLGDIQTA